MLLKKTLKAVLSRLEERNWEQHPFLALVQLSSNCNVCVFADQAHALYVCMIDVLICHCLESGHQHVDDCVSVDLLLDGKAAVRSCRCYNRRSSGTIALTAVTSGCDTGSMVICTRSISMFASRRRRYCQRDTQYGQVSPLSFQSWPCLCRWRQWS